MTRKEQLACLTDRPCAVCSKHTKKGCSSWKCVFEEKPEELTGYWIPHIGMNHECSACGNFFPLAFFAGRPFEINYCPNCGAHMIEKKVTE